MRLMSIAPWFGIALDHTASVPLRVSSMSFQWDYPHFLECLQLANKVKRVLLAPLCLSPRHFTF
jgi:hypothetical protein